MSDGETARYPFDPDVYGIGDVVTSDVVEQAYGRPTTHPKYRLGVMNAIEVLRRSLRARGITATIRQRKHDIEICSHTQAAAYNPKRVQSAERVIRQSLERMLGIDMTALPDDETRFKVTVECTRTGRKVQAIGSINRMKPTKLLAPPTAPSVKQITARKKKG